MVLAQLLIACHISSISITRSLYHSSSITIKFYKKKPYPSRAHFPWIDQAPLPNQSRNSHLPLNSYYKFKIYIILPIGERRSNLF